MNAKAGGNWLHRLRNGLGRSSSKLSGAIAAVLTRRRLDAQALEELEEQLIGADMGVATAARLTAAIASGRFEKEAAPEEVLSALAGEIARILAPVAKPLVIDGTHRPHVILVSGVNGSGKTTSIGKLAARLKAEGRTVMLAAGDTFRAAAIEQLQIWGQRTGCPVAAAAPGSDAASLAFEALRRARDEAMDVLIVDTAGRLQNKKDLMAELEKIVRVMRKLDPTAPHDCLLVLDAGVGQNAHSQVRAFAEMIDISGLILTKLDGTAKGGVVVALAEAFALPVHAVGVGEAIDDLQPFEAEAFARGLLGLS